MTDDRTQPNAWPMAPLALTVCDAPGLPYCKPLLSSLTHMDVQEAAETRTTRTCRAHGLTRDLPGDQVRAVRPCNTLYLLPTPGGRS
jgi:hypothetical protein